MMFSKYTDVKDSNDAVLDIFQAIYMFVRFYQIKLTVESDTSTTIAWALYVEVHGSSISFLMRSRCCPHEFKNTFVVHVHAVRDERLCGSTMCLRPRPKRNYSLLCTLRSMVIGYITLSFLSPTKAHYNYQNTPNPKLGPLLTQWTNLVHPEYKT
eukprot:TRINITY_DN6392_c0_g3_i2.p1 TRINITY_DN6392_c0_g3~~TRINITY_DN6392_c0_g3_i2.p1  ORF type:complete len:155 (-),score=4.85 TRINITY_DN6392_c0_g3_i2:484-948(-)